MNFIKTNYYIDLSGKVIMLFIAVVLSKSGIAQPGLSNIINRNDAISDFEYFRQALEKGHPNLYWFQSKSEIDEIFINTRKRIKADITYREFHDLLNNCMRAISCGHSSVLYPSAYIDFVDSVGQFLPINITLIGDKVYVIEDLSGSGIQMGSEIIKINGTKISEIIDYLKTKVPIDMGIKSKENRSIELLFPYYYTLYYGPGNMYSIDYMDVNHNYRMKEIAAIPWNSKILKSLKNRTIDDPIKWEIDKKNDISYLKIVTFLPNKLELSYTAFAEKLDTIFNIFKKSQTKNLIIDLRDNNGGNMLYATVLFSFVINKPYKYFKDVKMTKYIIEGNYPYGNITLAKEQIEKKAGGKFYFDGNHYVIRSEDVVSPQPNAFAGDIYLLTNGLSFSATGNFLAQCQDKLNALIVGEVPGSAYAGISAGQTCIVTLINSGFRLGFKIMATQLDLVKSQKAINVDYEVKRDIIDVINGTDIQKEYLYELLKHQSQKN